MRYATGLIVCGICLLIPHMASAYLMQTLTYEELFARAEIVVIATPVSTKDSDVDLELEVAQGKDVVDMIKTVETTFKVSVILKGKMEGETFRFLHLSRKEKKKDGISMFGEVGTFFVEFSADKMTGRSYILFLKKRADGTYAPAWRALEGSRAIIAVPRDGSL